MLVAQLIRCDFLRRELILVSLHILLQQFLHRLKPHTLLIHVVIYPSNALLSATLHIDLHQMAAEPLFQQHAQLQQTQFGDMII